MKKNISFKWGGEKTRPERGGGEENIAKLRSLASVLKNRDVFADFLPVGAQGIELGVAYGAFSKRLLSKNRSMFLYGVDMYAGDRGHDIVQYKIALNELKSFRDRICIIRSRFDEVVDLFEDDYFDFVYVDGYAHTGEEGGSTFRDWFPKVKPLGIIAGDDYHPDWPLVVKEVDEFVREYSLDLFVIPNSDNPEPEWSQWFAVKKSGNEKDYFSKLGDIIEIAARLNDL